MFSIIFSKCSSFVMSSVMSFVCNVLCLWCFSLVKALLSGHNRTDRTVGEDITDGKLQRSSVVPVTQNIICYISGYLFVY